MTEHPDSGGEYSNLTGDYKIPLFSRGVVANEEMGQEEGPIARAHTILNKGEPLFTIRSFDRDQDHQDRNLPRAFDWDYERPEQKAWMSPDLDKDDPLEKKKLGKEDENTYHYDKAYGTSYTDTGKDTITVTLYGEFDQSLLYRETRTESQPELKITYDVDFSQDIAKIVKEAYLKPKAAYTSTPSGYNVTATVDYSSSDEIQTDSDLSLEERIV